MFHGFAAILLGLLFTQSGVRSYKTDCPNSNNIKPCSCRVSSLTGSSPKAPQVTCKDLQSADDLKKPLSGLNGYAIDSLLISSSRLGVVPADLFRGASIGNITLSFASVKVIGNIFKPPFLGLEGSLETLILSNCFLDEKWPLTKLSVSHLQKLRILWIEGNEITSISDDWFENGPYDLTELTFLANEVKQVGSRAFSTLRNLRKLTLSENHILNVTRSMFPSFAKKLKYIDLSNNELQDLPADIFDDMPVLKEVLLQYTGIMTIKENTWSFVWHQLSTVDFTGNDIVCDSTLEWIYKSRLPPNLKGECATPEPLKGKALKDLTANDLKPNATSTY